MTYELKPLRRTDSHRCAEIERELFAGDDPWRAWAFEEELRAGHFYLGAYTDDGLVGYAGLAVNGRPPNHEAEIHTIGVTKAWQHKGIGRAMLVELLRRADERRAPVYLEVRADNDAAIALYEQYGFSKLGIRPRYYQPSGADAYTMAREASDG